MRIASDCGAAVTDQKIEVGSLVGRSRIIAQERRVNVIST
jgi:hypothetical protein